MKKRINSVLCVIVLLIVSCGKDEDPTYPIEPQIKFKDLKFGKASNGERDSLSLTISFTDGDGDLGLNEYDTEIPYHELNFFIFENSVLKKIPSAYDYSGYSSGKLSFIISVNENPDTKLVTEGLRKALNLTDIPSFEHPANCISYVYTSLKANSDIFSNPEIVEFEGTHYSATDTFYVERNENWYNIYLNFMVEQPDGSYKEFDWTTAFPYPSCGNTFDNRFFYIENAETNKTYTGGPFIIKMNTKFSGELTYTMQSTGFVPLFSGKKLKLRVSIKDRALHTSNVIETPVLQF